MELIIALALFIGLVASWLMLPGTALSTETAVESLPAVTHADTRGVVQQPA